MLASGFFTGNSKDTVFTRRKPSTSVEPHQVLIAFSSARQPHRNPKSRRKHASLCFRDQGACPPSYVPRAPIIARRTCSHAPAPFLQRTSCNPPPVRRRRSQPQPAGLRRVHPGAGRPALPRRSRWARPAIAMCLCEPRPAGRRPYVSARREAVAAPPPPPRELPPAPVRESEPPPPQQRIRAARLPTLLESKECAWILGGREGGRE